MCIFKVYKIKFEPKIYTMLNRNLKPLFSFFLFVFSVLTIQAQTIPSPEAYLGYKVGTKFTRHHQIVSYFNTIAQAKPDMVKIMPLSLIHISEPTRRS